MSEDNTKVDKIARALDSDANKFGTISRFGYFSIPYSSYLGDRYYSQGRKKVYRTQEKKVITEPRGIYTTSMKKGKFTDAFFSNMMKENPELQKKVAEMAEHERAAYIEAVKQRAKSKGEKNPSFIPSGPQEYKDYHAKSPIVYSHPIYKEIDKKTKIDKDKKSVYTEKRGIYTNPSKLGPASVPGILFSQYKEEPHMLTMKPKVYSATIKGKEKDSDFIPASLQKNEPFQKDKEIYGEDDNRVKQLISEMKENKKKPKPKFEKQAPPGSLTHNFNFKPASLVKTGKETLFSPITYKVEEHKEEIVVKSRKDDANKKISFTYNRLVDASKFSPPITSYLPNLKKAFPSVSFR